MPEPQPASGEVWDEVGRSPRSKIDPSTMGSPYNDSSLRSQLPLSISRAFRRPTWWNMALLLLLAIVAALFVLLWPRDKAFPRVSPVTSLTGWEAQPSFSPDGNEIAFSHGDSHHEPEIYVKALGGEKIVQLTARPGSSDCPSWSSDGKTIAYRHSGDTGAAIFLMTALGGSQRELRRLTEKWSCKTSWSPDSKLLVYGNQPVGESSGLFLFSLDESPERRITTAPDAMWDGDPAFSPDGKKIAFLRNTSSSSSDLYIVTISDLQIKQITFLNRILGSPTWTGDGRHVLFSIEGGFDGEATIFWVPAAGGKAERLPFFSADASEPTLSRGGDKLAFSTAFLDSNIW